ncbi:unnamed protein product [Rotaria sp. Silwood2]|nr:unnamed protein product [Rotaria sp. Silwood2]
MPQSLLSSEQELSVYFQMILKSCHSWVNKPIQHAVTAVHTVIRLDQAVRKEKAVSMRVDLIETRKVTLSQDRKLYGVEMRVEPNYPILGKKASAKVKSIIQQIRDMTDEDIEKLLSKDQNEDPLTTIDNVLIESEGIHIVYRVAK